MTFACALEMSLHPSNGCPAVSETCPVAEQTAYVCMRTFCELSCPVTTSFDEHQQEPGLQPRPPCCFRNMPHLPVMRPDISSSVALLQQALMSLSSKA